MENEDLAGVNGEAECDGNGHPICGQDFMAGTICQDAPGHPGYHNTTCQECGGDYMDLSCTCGTICSSCEATYVDDDNHIFCDDCACPTHKKDDAGDYVFCVYADHHPGPCEFLEDNEDDEGPSHEELAEVYRSLGAVPPIH